jgi:serine/threonine protein phosphatase PrpC
MTVTDAGAPAVERQLELRTPYGRPVAWAEVAMVSDIGDSHELNDDRCLVITSRDLGYGTDSPMGDWMLCLLADGATGSTFAVGDGRAQAGWRASQLAQAAFLERFLSSPEVDILDRLKEGLRAADQALVNSAEGRLSTTLTALFLASDGRAYATSIGDSVLLVLPPTRRTAGDRRLKKLGYEDTTAVGSGDTTLSYVDETELIEQWWPDKEGVDGRHVHMRVRPGTHFVLMSDGIADNLPIEAIEQLLRRHSLQSATVGLPRQTRERRARMQRRGGGSTNELGLDNMSAIVVRFRAPRRAGPAGRPLLQDAALLTLQGIHGGPTASSGGQFGLIGLAGREQLTTLVPTLLRGVIEHEQAPTMADRLTAAFENAARGQAEPARLSVIAVDEQGLLNELSSGWADLDRLVDVRIVERRVTAARDNLLQRFAYSPRVWGSSVAAAALFLLVSTAFATGTVRPSPPPAPTSAPGQPTPTPDTRPRLAIGGFSLLAPAPVPTATPTSIPTEVTNQAVPADAPAPTGTETTCANPLGVLCDAPPPAPARRPTPGTVQRSSAQQAPAPPPSQPDNAVILVASPAPASDVPGVGPPAGSQLDRALQIASVANDQFNRSLTDPLPRPTPER